MIDVSTPSQLHRVTSLVYIYSVICTEKNGNAYARDNSVKGILEVNILTYEIYIMSFHEITMG